MSSRKQKGHPARFRPSRASRWRTWTLIGVHVVMLAHVAHWLATGSTLTPLEPSEAMEVGKHGIVNAGALFFVLAILSTAVFGRFFCGWGCHLVALQDLCRWLLRKVGIPPRPLRSRLLGLVPLVAFVYMFLWPAAYRVWTGMPLERLHLVLVTSDFWATFPGIVVATITFVVCGFVAVYVLGSKGFCTYACPYGAAFAGATRIAPVGVRVTDACQSCAHCTASCTSNVRVHEEVRDHRMVVDAGCMKCLDCVSVCPNDALYVGLGRPALVAAWQRVPAKRRRSPVSWVEEGLLVVAFAAAFITFRGLYGAVPFLLALGLASTLAALTLVAVRLVRRTNLRFGGWQLKREGRLLRAGRVYCVVLAVLALVWAHSGWIRHHERRGQALYERTSGLRLAALDQGTPLRPVQGAELELVLGAAHHLELVERWGLVGDPRSTLRLAWLSLLSGRSEAFSRWMGAALEVRPETSATQLLHGRALVAAERYREAADSYSRAIELAPNMADGYLGLGTLLGRQGRLDRAVVVFERGAKAVPGDADLQHNWGVALAMRGQADQAIARFEAALELDPGHLQARENVAAILLGVGRWDEALAHLRAAVAQSPNDPSNHLLMARAHLGLGDHESAVSALGEALAIDPHLAEARALHAELTGNLPP